MTIETKSISPEDVERIRAFLDTTAEQEDVAEDTFDERTWNITGVALLNDSDGPLYMCSTQEGVYIVCGDHFGEPRVTLCDGSPPRRSGPRAKAFVEVVEKLYKETTSG